MPWPETEDLGIETRARNALRPLALLNAVVHGDPDTIAAALTAFRQGNMPDVGAQAVYFAVTRWGAANDSLILQQQLKESVAHGRSSIANMLFGLTAGATDKGSCTTGLDAIMTVCDDSSAIVSALWGVMQYAPACRDAAWAEYLTAATKFWASDGADATANITQGFAYLATADELTAATSLLASQNSSVISADVVHSVLTKIKINLDMVQANTKESYQYLHHVDTEEHKCYEACSASKFASKGITDSGRCPSEYDTVDKSVTVKQCPDGVTSVKYCSPINVTIATKGRGV